MKKTTQAIVQAIFASQVAENDSISESESDQDQLDLCNEIMPYYDNNARNAC